MTKPPQAKRSRKELVFCHTYLFVTSVLLTDKQNKQRIATTHVSSAGVDSNVCIQRGGQQSPCMQVGSGKSAIYLNSSVNFSSPLIHTKYWGLKKRKNIWNKFLNVIFSLCLGIKLWNIKAKCSYVFWAPAVETSLRWELIYLMVPIQCLELRKTCCGCSLCFRSASKVAKWP